MSTRDDRRVEYLRRELLRLDRMLVRWRGGRARKRLADFVYADAEMPVEIRIVQILRIAHELLDMMGHSTYEYRNAYDRYIDSDAWSKLSMEVLYERGYLCERCGLDSDAARVTGRGRMVVHHRSYERLGAELPEDLEVLCESCHRAVHGLPPLEPHGEA